MAASPGRDGAAARRRDGARRGGIALLLAAFALVRGVAGAAPAAEAGAGAPLDDAAASALNPGGRHLTLPSREGTDSRGALVDVHLARAVAGRSLETEIAVGRALFHRDWLADDGAPDVVGHRAAPPAGPDYDRSTCAGCHLEAAPAAAAPDGEAYLVARIVHRADLGRFGAQANTRRAGPGAPEARVDVDYRYARFVYPDGRTRRLREPVPSARAADGSPVPVALRAAPLLFGWGLVEHVDPEMLRHFHDPADHNGDGISGRMVWLQDECSGRLRPGLFGWKATQPTLRRQIAAALHNDMGVTSPPPCTAGAGSPEFVRAAATAPAAELDDARLDALTTYVRYLGVPDRRRRGDPLVRQGEKLFGRLGCNDCHVPVLQTREEGPAAFAGQTLWPYTDLMLHDMGPALAEAGDAADAREWRTAPLWGIGLVEATLPAHGFLHDGRAETIEDAILWHGGEAARSRNAFVHLSAAERRAVLAFVRAL